MQPLSNRACHPQPSSGSVNLFLLNLFMITPSLVAALVRVLLLLAGAGAIPADLCWTLLVIPSSLGNAINKQKSAGEASHTKIAPFPANAGRCHAWSGMMLCHVYKKEQCALLVSVTSVMVCNIGAPGNTAWSCKLSCLDMLQQTWSDLYRYYGSYSFVVAAAWKALISCFPWAVLSRSQRPLQKLDIGCWKIRS